MTVNAPEMPADRPAIHATAVVSDGAVIGAGSRVGPYAVIGEHVRIGRRCEVDEHVVLRGHTSIGDDCRIFPHAVIGGAPQHSAYRGEPTRVSIGDRVTLREGVTVNLGTAFGNQVTIIEDDVMIMAYAHIAHDCFVGHGTTIANAVQLAGHVSIQDNVMFGGHGAIAQFCRVGRHAYIAGGSILRGDVLPFMAGKGTEFRVKGVNAVGMRRKGYDAESIRRAREIYRIFYRQGHTAASAVGHIRERVGDSDETRTVLDFIAGNERGFER